MDKDGERPAKRIRQNHVYSPCPCYVCQGDMQLPATIRDHRKRHPWPAVPSPPPRSPTPEGQSMRHETDTSLPHHPAPSPPPISPPIQDIDDNRAHTHAQSSSTRRSRRARSPSLDLPGFRANDQREYRFDDLRPNRQYANVGVDRDLLDNLDAGGGGDEDQDDPDERWDDFYDAPHEDNPPGPEGEEQPFRLPWGDEPDPDEESDPHDDANLAEDCEAFREHPLIRNSYIDAVVQKSLYGANHRALTHQLKAARRQLRSNQDVPVDGLARMALTIRTAERRLGLDSSDIITTYTLCPLCRRSYHPDYIANAEENACQNEDCEGILYEIETLASGKRKRTSQLTYPCASIIAWLRRMFHHPGTSGLTNTWRTENDRALGRPISAEEWAGNINMDTPLGNITKGHGWGSRPCLQERVVDEAGNVRDRSRINPPIRLASLPFGLTGSLNSDWFRVTKEGTYSVGACYLVLDNIPRHLRFLRENICLLLIMPGPQEPSSYALDQMLAPVIEELLQLERGVEINIREETDAGPVYRDQVVYLGLSQHIADLLARIKLGGGAGVKSELNFCLYCRARLSSLSVPEGFIRQNLPYRDPQEDLNNAYYWQSLGTAEERRAFFEFTGNRFTALHWLPGWNTSLCSPPDAMHLLYLGGMKWILLQTLLLPGMLTRRQVTDEDPIARFNLCLDQMWMPKNYSRLPPKLGQTKTKIKADQWKLATRVIFIPLFMAFRVGDIIPNDCVRRGNKSSTGAKYQAARAKALHRERRKHYTLIGRPQDCPQIEDCFPSRNLQFHYKQVLSYSIATGTLDKRTVTPAEIQFGTQLLETLCIDYVENNIPLPPNFHVMMHLEESMLKYGSLYNSHVWGLERANGVLAGMKHNKRGQGELEGTLMRGWWGIANMQKLIRMYRALPDRTPDDEEVLKNLLEAFRGGAEHALQRGTLAAYIAQAQTQYTQLHGIHEPVRLSSQSRVIDLRKDKYNGVYGLFVEFCRRQWPDAGIFGNGMAPARLHLPPKGLIRNYCYIEYNGIRYGSFHHTNGCGYCYGYIGQERHAARIEWILSVDFPNLPELRTVCIVVRRFQLPNVEPEFPWSHWNVNLGTASWIFDELGDLEVISVDTLSGVFALFQVPMSQADYWVTVSLDTISPARDDPEDDEW